MANKKTDWTKIKPADIEKKVIELARQGIPPEKIGLMLRDQEGTPKIKLLGLKMKKILQKQDLWEDSEKANITKKIDSLKKHLEKNKHDYSAKRSIVKYTGRINKIERFSK